MMATLLPLRLHEDEQRKLAAQPPLQVLQGQHRGSAHSSATHAVGSAHSSATHAVGSAHSSATHAVGSAHSSAHSRAMGAVEVGTAVEHDYTHAACLHVFAVGLCCSLIAAAIATATECMAHRVTHASVSPINDSLLQSADFTPDVILGRTASDLDARRGGVGSATASALAVQGSAAGSRLTEVGRCMRVHSVEYFIGVLLPLAIVHKCFMRDRPCVIPWMAHSFIQEQILTTIVHIVQVLAAASSYVLLIRIPTKMVQLLGFVISSFTFFGLAIALISVGEDHQLRNATFSAIASSTLFYDAIFIFVTTIPVVSTFVILVQSTRLELSAALLGGGMAVAALCQSVDMSFIATSQSNSVMLLLLCGFSVCATAVTVGVTPQRLRKTKK